MQIEICAAAGCNEAVELTNDYDLSGQIGWTEIRRVVEIQREKREDDGPLPPEPEILHGEVTIRGERCAFTLHKPKELADREKLVEERWRRPLPPEYHQQSVRLCPKCSPKLPVLKGENLR